MRSRATGPPRKTTSLRLRSSFTSGSAAMSGTSVGRLTTTPSAPLSIVVDQQHDGLGEGGIAQRAVGDEKLSACASCAAPGRHAAGGHPMRRRAAPGSAPEPRRARAAHAAGAQGHRRRRGLAARSCRREATSAPHHDEATAASRSSRSSAARSLSWSTRPDLELAPETDLDAVARHRRGAWQLSGMPIEADLRDRAGGGRRRPRRRLDPGPVVRPAAGVADRSPARLARAAGEGPDDHLQLAGRRADLAADPGRAAPDSAADLHLRDAAQSRRPRSPTRSAPARSSSSWCRRARWSSACAPAAPAWRRSTRRPASARRSPQGKEERVFDGRRYILETAIRADYAFLQAHQADARRQRHLPPRWAQLRSGVRHRGAHDDRRGEGDRRGRHARSGGGRDARHLRRPHRADHPALRSGVIRQIMMMSGRTRALEGRERRRRRGAGAAARPDGDARRRAAARRRVRQPRPRPADPGVELHRGPRRHAAFRERHPRLRRVPRGGRRGSRPLQRQRPARDAAARDQLLRLDRVVRHGAHRPRLDDRARRVPGRGQRRPGQLERAVDRRRRHRRRHGPRRRRRPDHRDAAPAREERRVEAGRRSSAIPPPRWRA